MFLIYLLYLGLRNSEPGFALKAFAENVNKKRKIGLKHCRNQPLFLNGTFKKL